MTEGTIGRGGFSLLSSHHFALLTHLPDSVPEPKSSVLASRIVADLLAGQPPGEIAETLHRELSSLSLESNPEMYYDGLLAFGIRQEAANRGELAARVYQIVGAQQGSAALRVRAEQRLAAMFGGATVGSRFEFLARRFCADAADPAMIAGMAVGQAMFAATRTALLARWLATPERAVLGARAMAFTCASALEVPSFWASTKGLHQLLSGESGSWDLPSAWREMAGLGLTLSALKLTGAASLSLGRRLLELPSSAPLGAAWSLGGQVGLGLLHQAGMLGGIVLGHSLEEAVGLRARGTETIPWLDSLVTLLQFNVGGRLAQEWLGSGFQTYARELEARLHRLETIATPAQANFDSPGVPGRQLAFSMTSLPAVRSSPEINRPELLLIKGSTDSGARKSTPAAGFEAVTLPAVFTQGIPYFIKVGSHAVADGLPLLQVKATSGGNAVEAVLRTLEEYIKKGGRKSVVIHFGGTMFGTRDQEQIKQELNRRLFEKKTISDEFSVVIAVPNGIPKMALIFTKRNGKMLFEWTIIKVPEASAKLPIPAKVARIPEGIRQADSAMEVLRLVEEVVQGDSPKLRLRGAWRPLQDPAEIAKKLEAVLPRRNTQFTLILEKEGVQVVFYWGREQGEDKVLSRTEPIGSDPTSIPSLPAFSTPVERSSEPAAILPVAPPPAPTAPVTTFYDRIAKGLDTPVNKWHSCYNLEQVMASLHTMLLPEDGKAFSSVQIEMKRGIMDVSDLLILGEVLGDSPMPEGGKVTISWQDSPHGRLELKREHGRTTVDLHQFGVAVQTFTLIVDGAGISRFKPAGNH